MDVFQAAICEEMRKRESGEESVAVECPAHRHNIFLVLVLKQVTDSSSCLPKVMVSNLCLEVPRHVCPFLKQYIAVFKTIHSRNTANV